MIWYRKFLLSDHESLIVLHVTENCVGQPSTDSSFLHGLIAPSECSGWGFSFGTLDDA